MSLESDVVVVGGGPAGLAAAMWLARYRLDTVLIDAGNPRNAPATAVHGYLGLPDVPPRELRRIGREQAVAAGARIRDTVVLDVTGEIGGFRVDVEDGPALRARRVLFATGLRDIVPEIPGLRECYGTSIWHCPDCDGPSVVGCRIGVIGWGRQIAAFCMEMLTWTERQTILTHGHDPDLPPRSSDSLERWGIDVNTAPVSRIEHEGGQVRGVTLATGEHLPFDALFFHIAYGPGCSIPADLGCEANEEGILRVDADFETSVPGVYAAGDIVHGSKLAIHAAADGTRAAIGIYRSLLPRERRV